MRVKDLSIIVTGAGSGIGEGIAKRLAAEGAKVVVNDVNAEQGQRVTADIVAAGGNARATALSPQWPIRACARGSTWKPCNTTSASTYERTPGSNSTSVAWREASTHSSAMRATTASKRRAEPSSGSGIRLRA